jgi:hypothetical protein
MRIAVTGLGKGSIDLRGLKPASGFSVEADHGVAGHQVLLRQGECRSLVIGPWWPLETDQACSWTRQLDQEPGALGRDAHMGDPVDMGSLLTLSGVFGLRTGSASGDQDGH